MNLSDEPIEGISETLEALVDHANTQQKALELQIDLNERLQAELNAIQTLVVALWAYVLSNEDDPDKEASRFVSTMLNWVDFDDEALEIGTRTRFVELCDDISRTVLSRQVHDG